MPQGNYKLPLTKRLLQRNYGLTRAEAMAFMAQHNSVLIADSEAQALNVLRNHGLKCRKDRLIPKKRGVKRV
jgi:hypothetical protein